MLCSVKILLSDRNESDYLSNEDCPLARALNRRMKADYYVVCGGTNYDIYHNGKILHKNIEIPNTWRSDRFNSMEKNIVIKIEIPDECLKRIHK